jgi:hypothetical protein
LIDAGMADAIDRHVHVTVLRRAVMQAGGLGEASASAA